MEALAVHAKAGPSIPAHSQNPNRFTRANHPPCSAPPENLPLLATHVTNSCATSRRRTTSVPNTWRMRRTETTILSVEVEDTMTRWMRPTTQMFRNGAKITAHLHGKSLDGTGVVRKAAAVREMIGQVMDERATIVVVIMDMAEESSREREQRVEERWRRTGIISSSGRCWRAMSRNGWERSERVCCACKSVVSVVSCNDAYFGVIKVVPHLRRTI